MAPSDAKPSAGAPVPEAPQLCLITPPSFEPVAFGPRLGAALDAVPVACLRLALADADAATLARSIDSVRAEAHARDVPVVIDRHLVLARRHGLDGVHLPDGARGVRAARKELGPDAIVGAFCRASRHEGISAGEAGADYVAFGPVAGELGDGVLADTDLFAWWSEMIEIPVLAEGGLTPDLVRRLVPVVDFITLGAEVWSREDPVAALRAFHAALAG